jgi:16S rRNA (guanine527-N7)-methyltransferase
MSAPHQGDDATRERPTRANAGRRNDPLAFAAALAADRERALALTPVSRETLARLDRFVEALLEWQQHTNLVAPSTEPAIWTRHIADSLQLLPLAPEAQIWADLGSGGGFPGLIVACVLAERSGAEVHLVESIGKKTNFLREAARVTGAPVEVHAMRIADFIRRAPKRLDVVTARALAPLPKLLAEAYPLLKRGARGLFAKGQDVGTELTQAAKCWNIKATWAESRTDPRSRIVIVESIDPKVGSRAGPKMGPKTSPPRRHNF